MSISFIYLQLTTYAYARDCRWDNYITYEQGPVTGGTEYNLKAGEAIVGLWSALRRKKYSYVSGDGNGFRYIQFFNMNAFQI